MKIMIKTCLYCKIEFNAKRKDTLFCSDVCSQKNYRINNKEKLKQIYKNYRLKNKDKIKETESIYSKNNHEKLLKRYKQYREKNKEEINKKALEYYYNNKENMNKKAILRRNNKRQNDPYFKLQDSMRSRIRRVIKDDYGHKNKKTLELLGCSFDYFKQWLESQFEKNMTWNNYGNYWHIDHILPCAEFDLRNSEEQEICFHYTNLRPLEAKENLSKSKKII